MPQIAVGALLTGAISVGVTAATAGIAAVTLATFAVPAAITLGVGLISRALAPKPPRFAGVDAAVVDPVTSATRGAVERTINAAITPARWIIGTVRCTGRIVWVHVDDDEAIVNQDTRRDTVSSLHMAMVLSQDSCDSIQEIWLDGDQLTVTKTTDNNHSVYKAEGFELHEYFKADGSEGSECFAAASGATLSFDAADVSGEGLSWVYIKLTQNDYGNDLESRRFNKVPNIEFVIKGVKMSLGRDPAGAKVYTENAAVVRKWWLTERRGFDYRLINRAYYRAAVTRCDTMIDISGLTNFNSSAMSTDLARYTINGLIHSGEDVSGIEQDMDFAWDGAVVEWDGELLFRPGGQRAAVKEITGEDIVEEPLYRPGTTLSANRYVCDIPQSEWHDYLPYTLTVDDTGKQQYDGSIQTVNLGRTDLVSNPAQAANLLRSAARRARASSSLELTIMPGDNFENAAILPGDKVTINIPDIALNDADYFVMDTRVLAGWSIKLVLVEWGSDWYDDSFSLDHYSPRQVLSVGTLTAPDPVTVSIAAAQNDDGTFVWFALLTMPVSVWQYNIRYKPAVAGDTEWQESTTNSSQTTVQLNTSGEWTFEVRSESRDGRQSPATTVKATAGFSIDLPPDPVLARKTVEQGYLRYVFNNLGKFVNGLEIAYNFADIDDTAPGNIADAAAFEAAEQLGQYTIVPANSLTDERTIVDSIPKIGQFNLYVRARDIAGRYSGIVRLGLETLRLDPPSNVDVDELGDGTRSYTWTLPLSEHIAGAVIRYKKAGSHIPTPGPIENAPPTIIAANVTADGDVILGYSEPLDTGSKPAKSRYTVSADGTDQTPATVTIDTNTVTLTLTTKITVGQDVTVSYRVPNNNPLQDTHDEAAAALTGYAVSNILRDAANEPAWSSMEPLHEGYLASSPYYTKLPGAGIWDIAFRSISRSGRLSSGITYVQVALAEPVQLDIAEAVKKAIADNPALITLTTEVDAAEAARDRAIKAAQDGEAFRDSAQSFKNAAETAKDAAEQAQAAVATAKTAVDQAKTDAETSADTAQTEAAKASASAGKAATSETNAAGSETAAAAHVRTASAEAQKAANSASASATSASTAASEASDAEASATAAETAETNAKTAQARAETAETNASSSETAADGSAKAAASSLSAVKASADAADAAKDAAESAKDDAETAEGNASSSASAAAESAKTAKAHADTAGTEASAAEVSRTKAETAQSNAETAESNAASSATAADGSADAAAASESAVAASAKAAKDSADAAATSSQTATAKATEAAQSATAADTAKTAAETAQSNAGTSETNAATSETNADGSATAAADSATAAAASASTAADSATASAASATTAAAKATEVGTFASAAETAQLAAETAEANAKTSETNAVAAQTTADGFAAAAKLSSEAAAGFATTAQQAIAGITATVTAEVDKNLKVTFASIIAMRAVAGDTSAKLELVALSDPSGSRAAGVMTGDFQSFDFTAGKDGSGWRLGRDGKGELDAAFIRGTLDAGRVNADNLRSWDNLLSRSVSLSSTVQAFKMDLTGFGSLQLYVLRSSGWEIVAMPVALIASGTTPSKASDDINLSYNGTNLYISGTNVTLGQIWGLRTNVKFDVSFARDPDKDIDINYTPQFPRYIWSDGTTMWVTRNNRNVTAYRLATGVEDSNKSFILNSANTSSRGIWSDGTTMWVADNDNHKIYAYNLSTGARDSAKEFNTSVPNISSARPRGIWSDGTTMWVAFSTSATRIYAYNLSTGARDSAKDFKTSVITNAGNNNIVGIWSDGTTMWVADFLEDKIYAYNLSTKARDSAKEFNTLKGANNIYVTGIWSDGTTMWVVDAIGRPTKIFAYHMPSDD